MNKADLSRGPQRRVTSRRPMSSLIHHSDCGGQYAAEAYRAELARHGLIGSIDQRGDPYDNAKAESVMKTLKVEGVDPMACESLAEVAADLPRYIDTYNVSRLDSALGYLSPEQFEQHHPRQTVITVA